MGRRKRRMQDAKRPLLSIFVSVYNLENYIEECLDSILQQPFQDYEILLFDNGSIDRSIEISRQNPLLQAASSHCGWPSPPSGLHKNAGALFYADRWR